MPDPRSASPARTAGGSLAAAAAPERGAERSSDAPLGILAGGGQFPIDIAEATLRRGRQVHFVALDGFADQDRISGYPHERVGLGQVGRILSSFRRAGCRELIIAGTLQRPNLLRLRIDAGFLRHLPTVAKLTRGGDDSVLRRVVRFFEGEGFAVRGVPDIAPELLAGAGDLGSVRATAEQRRAIERASGAIAAFGPFDIGQAVVATPDRIVAIESTRGTDAMLAELGPDGVGAGAGSGGVLVKLAKPGQELRVDLPAIGLKTVQRASAAGLAGIAVGAGAAVVLERERMGAEANHAGLFVTGVTDTAVSDRVSASTVTRWTPDDIARLSPLQPLARRVPTPSDRRDISISREVLEVMRREGAGRAAVVAREHVLLVAGALPVAPLLAPLGQRHHWGLRAFRSRIGTLALDLTGLDDSTVEATFQIDVFRAARDARLAGLICVGRTIPAGLRDTWAGWSNDGMLFLMGESP